MEEYSVREICVDLVVVVCPPNVKVLPADPLHRLASPSRRATQCLMSSKGGRGKEGLRRALMADSCEDGGGGLWLSSSSESGPCTSWGQRRAADPQLITRPIQSMQNVFPGTAF